MKNTCFSNKVCDAQNALDTVIWAYNYDLAEMIVCIIPSRLKLIEVIAMHGTFVISTYQVSAWIRRYRRLRSRRRRCSPWKLQMTVREPAISINRFCIDLSRVIVGAKSFSARLSVTQHVLHTGYTCIELSQLSTEMPTSASPIFATSSRSRVVSDLDLVYNLDLVNHAANLLTNHHFLC